MAKSSHSAQKPPRVAEFPAGNPVAEVLEPETATPFDGLGESNAPPPPAKNPRGRPAKNSPPIESTFFSQVQAIDPADWGTRVYLYLYVLEPLCNLKQQGGRSYLMRYEEPIADEHRIMLEQGSGRYRFILAKNKTSPEHSNELCRYEFEIYNPQYPPKIPKEAWINDARNRKWEALLPKVDPAPVAGQAGSLLDAMRVYKDIRSEVRDEIEPAAAPAAAPAAPAVDAWAAAERILNMRADNPMMAILQQQMKDNAATLEAERDRAFKAQEAAREREFKLQAQLLESKSTVTASQQPKGLLEQITELAAVGDKLEPLKKLFNWGASTAAEGPARRTTGLELAREVVGKLIDSPIAEGFGQFLGSLAMRNAQGNAAPPAMNPAPANGTTRPAPQALPQFIEQVINPALMSHYVRGLSGSDFAAWLADGYPDRLPQLQNFTHPMIPGQRGAQAIVTAYKNSPSMWPSLSSAGEAPFVQFVSEFCAWKAEPEEIQDAETIDVGTQPEGEEEPERI